MLFLASKKAPAGCPDSKTNVLDISENIPDPNATKLFLKILVFKNNSVKAVDFRKKNVKSLDFFQQSNAQPGSFQLWAGFSEVARQRVRLRGAFRKASFPRPPRNGYAVAPRPRPPSRPRPYRPPVRKQGLYHFQDMR